MDIGEGIKLFYHGEDNRRNGVGIAVSGSLKDMISAVDRISDRIVVVRLDTQEGHYDNVRIRALNRLLRGREG